MRRLNINCILTDSTDSLNLNMLTCIAALQEKAQIRMFLEYLNMTTSPILFNRYFINIHIHTYRLTGHFFRCTCSTACLRKYLIRQSNGSNSRQDNQDNLRKFKLSQRMGKKGDFERGMLVLVPDGLV